MKSRTVPISLSILLAGLILGPPAAAAVQIDVFKPIAAQFPKTCKRTVIGMSGLCLLGSTAPKVKNPFQIRQVNPAGPASAQAQPVPFNTFLRLQPGQYLLYAASGMDNLHEFKLTIFPGAQTMVQTATVKFNAGGKAHRLQHYQPTGGIDGRGCNAEVIRSGIRAVLPGNYQVSLMEKAAANASPNCLTSGVTFNVLAGKAVASTTRKVKDQTLAAAHTYKHPDGVSSLASMSRFTADIERLGFLPRWKSYRGIHNPDASLYDALILSGIGSQQYVVPFTWRGKQRECGLSLPKAGLPAHVLLTDCKFRGRKLTEFRVNAGSYYTVNNRHGKTAIEGNFINNPILVSGVNFDIQGGH